MSTTSRTDALAPVRTELLRAARADAEALLAETSRDAAEALAAARTEAEAILDRARREGEADGEAVRAEETARARRAARTAELAARGEALARLHDLVTARLRELYEADPAIGEQLTARARALLGPDARVTAHPDGGILAVAPGRRVDLGLPALAARALDRLGPEVEELWRA